MSAFKVTTESGRVVVETDDWVEAQERVLASHRSSADWLRVSGTHPTHDWDDQRPRRCRTCGGADNGSYGSQSPCGYDWDHASLVGAVEREMATRVAASPEGSQS